MAQVIDAERCGECGARLVNIATGAVCPEGCGKVQQAVSREANRLAVREARMKRLPLATRLPAKMLQQDEGGKVRSRWLFGLADRAGLWVRVARTSGGLRSPKTAGNVLARMSGDESGEAFEPIELTRFDGLDGWFTPPDDPEEMMR